MCIYCKYFLKVRCVNGVEISPPYILLIMSLKNIYQVPEIEEKREKMLVYFKCCREKLAAPA